MTTIGAAMGRKSAQTNSDWTPYKRDLAPERRPPFFDRLDNVGDVVAVWRLRKAAGDLGLKSKKGLESSAALKCEEVREDE